MQAATLPETHYSVVSNAVNYLHQCSKLNTLTGYIQDTAANASNKLHAKVRGKFIAPGGNRTHDPPLHREQVLRPSIQYLLHYHLATRA